MSLRLLADHADHFLIRSCNTDILFELLRAVFAKQSHLWFEGGLLRS